MSKHLNRLQYFIPIYGTLKLIKKLEKLERRINAHQPMDEVSFQYYEARIGAIYNSIMSRIDQTEAIYFPQSTEANGHRGEAALEAAIGSASDVPSTPSRKTPARIVP